MSPQPDDKELGDFLARRSPVSREYSALGAEEPPAALDAQILAAAAATARPKARRRRPRLWWLRPAALAATVLLSLSLVLRLGELPAPPRSAIDESAVPVTVLPPAMKENMQPPPPVMAMKPQVVTAPAPPQLVGGLGTAELRARQFAADAAARPALTPDAVKRILEAIEARLAPAQPQEAAPADARLREILALSNTGQEQAVAAALTEFARDFPGDPISALVRAPAQ